MRNKAYQWPFQFQRTLRKHCFDLTQCCEIFFLNLLFWKHSGKICFNLFCFSCQFLSNVWYEMPIYRTNSDRGLWKKYREPQPQHFHKPSYLELDKSKPQVSLVFNYTNQPLKLLSGPSIHPSIHPYIHPSICYQQNLEKMSQGSKYQLRITR